MINHVGWKQMEGMCVLLQWATWLLFLKSNLTLSLSMVFLILDFGLLLPSWYISYHFWHLLVTFENMSICLSIDVYLLGLNFCYLIKLILTLASFYCITYKLSNVNWRTLIISVIIRYIIKSLIPYPLIFFWTNNFAPSRVVIVFEDKYIWREFDS